MRIENDDEEWYHKLLFPLGETLETYTNRLCYGKRPDKYDLVGISELYQRRITVYDASGNRLFDVGILWDDKKTNLKLCYYLESDIYDSLVCLGWTAESVDAPSPGKVEGRDLDQDNSLFRQ
jgi:hypothetical protein